MNLETEDRDLVQRWYLAQDTPMALRRSRHRLETPWVGEVIRKHIGYHAKVLDMGCAAGFVANALALLKHQVTAIDLTASVLKVAESCDVTHSVDYQVGDAYQLPFEKESFDVVIALDLMEYLSDRHKLISEATRVLKPGGLFFFNAVNKTFLSWLVVLQGPRWLFKKVDDEDLVYSLFIDPKYLRDVIEDFGLEIFVIKGVRPAFSWRLLWDFYKEGSVPDRFEYRFTDSLSIRYIGCARKLREH